MTEIKQTFRDRLVYSEPVTPALRERYEKEIQVMFNKPVVGIQKWSWLAASVMSGCIAVVFTGVALFAPAGVPVSARIGLLIGVVFAAVSAVFGLRVYRRGTLNLKTDATLYSGIIWVFTVTMVTFFMMYAPNDLVGLRMITCGIVFLIGGAVFLLRGVAERLELQTREKLLEVEYRLAEIEELIKARQ